MDYKIRTYKSTDDEAVVSIWNNCLFRDRIDIENFYKRVIFDKGFNPELFFIALEEDVLCGFIYAAMGSGERGWIVAMGVEPSYRRNGIGSALLTEAETALKTCGAKNIGVGAYTGNYFFPGVDVEAYGNSLNLLLRHGYEVTDESVSMCRNLSDYVYPEKYIQKKKLLENDGYRIKHFEPRDTLSLYAFIREDFPDWIEIIRENVVSGRAQDSMIIAQNKSGNTVGFVMCAMDGQPERFGPFGVKHDLQGIGLGSVLFNEMMLRFCQRRIYYTYFLWTRGRNIDFYSSWGMKIYRRYKFLSKDNL